MNLFPEMYNEFVYFIKNDSFDVVLPFNFFLYLTKIRILKFLFIFFFVLISFFIRKAQTQEMYNNKIIEVLCLR